MSIAVAVSKGGRTVIAADSQENFGDRRVPRSNHRSAKILRVGTSYLATTGWGLYDNILQDYLARARSPRLGAERQVFAFFLRFWKALRDRYSFVNDQSQEDDPTPFADLDSSFLLANGAGIFQISGNLSVTRFEQYYAVGSGASYALGATHALYEQKLDAEEIARRACAAAIAFDVSCGGDMDVYAFAARPRRAKRAAKR